MSAFAKRPSIAVSKNNVAGLTRIHRLSKPLFEMYGKYITIEFEPFELEELSLGRTYKTFGLPACVWVFEALTSEEYQYWITTFIPAGTREGAVTIRTLNIEDDVWANYSALAKRPKLSKENWNGYEYRNIRFEFYDLEIIT